MNARNTRRKVHRKIQEILSGGGEEVLRAGTERVRAKQRDREEESKE